MIAVTVQFTAITGCPSVTVAEVTQGVYIKVVVIAIAVSATMAAIATAVALSVMGIGMVASAFAAN